MTYNLSVCCFIKDTFKGAFCIFESMAMLLPIASEFIILDLGSTDGTLERLNEIALANPKIKLLQGEWPEIDAGAFATLANDLVAKCRYDNVLYYQADEIWHEDLLARMEKEFEQGNFDLSFWRIQYRYNFQYSKWLPHLVHRVGQKGRFEFDDDGMNTTRAWDARLCSQYDGSYFPKWGQIHKDLGDDGIKPYVNDMIMDVSQVGGFRDNNIDKRLLHAPFWHEDATLPDWREDGKSYQVDAQTWIKKALNNPDWTKLQSPFNLPKIMRYHVGKTRYTLRDDLLEALKRDETREYIEAQQWR